MMIEQLTKMPFELQNQQLRFFARANTNLRLKILENQRQQFHKLKSHHSDLDNPTLTLASLLISIHETIDSLDQVDMNVIKLRSKRTKQQQKRERLLRYWAIIKQLKSDQQMSFREISKYLFKYHKLEVSYTTIHSVWKEIENENKGTKNG